MKVREAMSMDVKVIDSDQSIREAAQLMADCDCGALPVSRDDRLVGIVTDRDIAVRAVAAGLGPDTPIGDVMSPEVMYCFDDDELDKVANNMGDIQVRRLPVVSRDKRLVGILAVCDLAACEDTHMAGKTIFGISTPGGNHSQALL